MKYSIIAILLVVPVWIEQNDNPSVKIALLTENV